MAAEFTSQANGILHDRLADIEQVMGDLGRAIDQVLFIRDQQVITGESEGEPVYHEAFVDTDDSTAAQKLAYLQLLESLAGSVRGSSNAAIRAPFVRL